MAHVTWMDEATRSTALDKADAIVHKIGYPDFVANPTMLDQYYQQVWLYWAFAVVTFVPVEDHVIRSRDR